MYTLPSRSHALKRYLTLFLSFALGLVIILTSTACDRAGGPLLIQPSTTQSSAPGQTASPALFGTQANTKSIPTLLPAIPPTPNERTPSPLGVTANQLTGLQVSLWHPWTGVTARRFQAILEEFNHTNTWGITVRVSSYEGFGGLDGAVDSAINSNLLPDILVDYGYHARQWDERGILVDLTPYVNDTVWGLTIDEKDDFYPVFWAEDLATSGLKPKSRRLGIPYYRSAYVLFYNQSWAKELGYPSLPNTPEDFKQRACAAADAFARQGDKSNLGKGGWLITSEPGTLEGWIYAFGGSITNQDATGYVFNTPETTQALAYLKGLQERGCAWANPGISPQVAFANRQALFIVGSLFDIPTQSSAFAQAGSSDDWVVIPFPSTKQPVVDTYGPSLVMVHSTPARQLASWLVVEWLVYPPNQAEIVRQLEVYPTRQSTLSYLTGDGTASPQWTLALGLLPNSRSEPSIASWSMMRWALTDAATQLFSLQFGSDQIPALIGNLDSVAEEVFNQVR